MNMKLIVLFLAFATLASASIFGTKGVHILDDGALTVHDEHGKQIKIFKRTGPFGKNLMEIEVTGPNTVTKKIQIDDQNQVKVSTDMDSMTKNYRISSRMAEMDDMDMERYKRSHGVGSSQTDILTEIMREFQGVIDEASFEQLMSKVEKAVEKGLISRTVLDHLQTLFLEQPLTSWERMGTMSPRFFNMQRSNKWGLSPSNKWGLSPMMGLDRDEDMDRMSMQQEMLRGKLSPHWFEQGSMMRTNDMDLNEMLMSRRMPLWCQTMNCLGDQDRTMMMTHRMPIMTHRMPMMSYEQMMRMKGMTPMEMNMRQLPWTQRFIGQFPISKNLLEEMRNREDMTTWDRRSNSMEDMRNVMPLDERMDQQLFGKRMMF